jgi:hypothetical protein
MSYPFGGFALLSVGLLALTFLGELLPFCRLVLARFRRLTRASDVGLSVSSTAPGLLQIAVVAVPGGSCDTRLAARSRPVPEGRGEAVDG